jgi:hypothetical protein
MPCPMHQHKCCHARLLFVLSLWKLYHFLVPSGQGSDLAGVLTAVGEGAQGFAMRDEAIGVCLCTDQKPCNIRIGKRNSFSLPMCEEPGYSHAKMREQPMTTFTVTDCSTDSQLQDAISRASDGDTITFACSGAISDEFPVSFSTRRIDTYAHCKKIYALSPSVMPNASRGEKRKETPMNTRDQHHRSPDVGGTRS